MELLTQVLKPDGQNAMASVTMPNAQTRNLIIRQHYGSKESSNCPLTYDGGILKITDKRPQINQSFQPCLDPTHRADMRSSSPRRFQACLAPINRAVSRSRSPRRDQDRWESQGWNEGWTAGWNTGGWSTGGNEPWNQDQTPGGDLHSCDDGRTFSSTVAHPNVRDGYSWPSTSHGRR